MSRGGRRFSAPPHRHGSGSCRCRYGARGRIDPADKLRGTRRRSSEGRLGVGVVSLASCLLQPSGTPAGAPTSPRPHRRLTAVAPNSHACVRKLRAPITDGKQTADGKPTADGGTTEAPRPIVGRVSPRALRPRVIPGGSRREEGRAASAPGRLAYFATDEPPESPLVLGPVPTAQLLPRGVGQLHLLRGHPTCESGLARGRYGLSRRRS